MMLMATIILLLTRVLVHAGTASNQGASVRLPLAFVGSTPLGRPRAAHRRRCGKRPSGHLAIAPSRLQSSSNGIDFQPLEQLADDDLVAVPFDAYLASSTDSPAESSSNNDATMQLRLCVVRNQGETILPLIRHEDDVETDLFLDPRHVERDIPLSDVMAYWAGVEERTEAVPYYGVGWYGQRPVPSLGGGPGYGAEADEVWSVDEEMLETMLGEGNVEIPVIDVGMAHGEKARGGALF